MILIYLQIKEHFMVKEKKIMKGIVKRKQRSVYIVFFFLYILKDIVIHEGG